MDPFEALGLPRSWRLPAEQIRAAQRRVCAASHPDRFQDAAARADAPLVDGRPFHQSACLGGAEGGTALV